MWMDFNQWKDIYSLLDFQPYFLQWAYSSVLTFFCRCWSRDRGSLPWRNSLLTLVVRTWSCGITSWRASTGLLTHGASTYSCFVTFVLYLLGFVPVRSGLLVFKWGLHPALFCRLKDIADTASRNYLKHEPKKPCAKTKSIFPLWACSCAGLRCCVSLLCISPNFPLP